MARDWQANGARRRWSVCCCVLPGEANAAQTLCLVTDICVTWSRARSADIWAQELSLKVKCQYKYQLCDNKCSNKRNKGTSVPRTAPCPVAERTEAQPLKGKNKEAFSRHSCQQQDQGKEGTRGFAMFSAHHLSSDAESCGKSTLFIRRVVMLRLSLSPPLFFSIQVDSRQMTVDRYCAPGNKPASHLAFLHK